MLISTKDNTMNRYACKTKWVRGDDGRKVGYLIAYAGGDFTNAPNTVHIGFSFCDTRFDKFNFYKAFDIAEMRADYFLNAKNGTKILEKVPYKYRDEFIKFLKDCGKYFKNRTFPEWFYEIYPN